MEKQIKLHHSISELGNIQVRQVVEYVKNGEVIDRKYSDPYTPADTKDMTGWDDRSKAIVSAVTDEKVLAEFAIERQKPTGVGVEEIVTHDRTLNDFGRIAVRRITRIFDEGEEISKKYHRSWIIPGQDLAGNDVMSKAIAEKLHTPEVIAVYEAQAIAERAVITK